MGTWCEARYQRYQLGCPTAQHRTIPHTSAPSYCLVAESSDNVLLRVRRGYMGTSLTLAAFLVHFRHHNTISAPTSPSVSHSVSGCRIYLILNPVPSLTLLPLPQIPVSLQTFLVTSRADKTTLSFQRHTNKRSPSGQTSQPAVTHARQTHHTIPITHSLTIDCKYQLTHRLRCDTY